MIDQRRTQMAQRMALQERGRSRLPTLDLIDQILAEQSQQAPQAQTPSFSEVGKGVIKGLPETAVKHYAGDAIKAEIASQLGLGGSAALTTQGAAGYNATAAALPELFGGTSAAVAPTAISSTVPAATTASTLASAFPPAAAATIFIAGLSQLTQSKKGGDQKKRDVIRNRFNDLGITDNNFVTPTGVNVGKNLSEQAGQKGVKDYDLFNKDGTPVDPLVPFLVNRVNPISTFIAAGDSKAGSDATGLLVKSVLASKPKNEAEADAALKNVFANLNVGKSDIAKQIQASGGGLSDVDMLSQYIANRKKSGDLEIARSKQLRNANPNFPLLESFGGMGRAFQLSKRGVSDERLAKELGVNFNSSGVSPEDLLRGTRFAAPKEMTQADLLTKQEQEIALANLQRANYIRG